MAASPPKHWSRQMNNSDKLSSSSALHGWWSGGFSSSRRQNIWNCTLHTSAPPAFSSENNISLYSEDTIKGSGFTFPLIWSTFSSSKSFSSIFLFAVTLNTTGDADPLPLVFTTSSSTGLFSSISRVFSSSIGKAAVFPPDFWRWNVGNIFCLFYVVYIPHQQLSAPLVIGSMWKCLPSFSDIKTIPDYRRSVDIYRSLHYFHIDRAQSWSLSLWRFENRK